ncbi:hypothetical protein TIB1ST10_05900 [Cutibacterium acnes 6609]|nr:hypothetical protein TIB1ST10_05900 [Cutibacterium acnes 6609]
MVDRLSHDVAAKVGVVASSPLIRLLNTFMRLGGGVIAVTALRTN